MADFILKAAKRNILGKKTRFLRRQDITPTHLFGHNIKSLTLQCNTTELQHVISQSGTTRLIDIHIEAEKQPRSVFIREIQRDEIGGQLLHVDFYQIRKTEKMTADIPIVLIGEAPAAKSKDNMIEHSLTQIGIECLPHKLPPQIEIDLGLLEDSGQAIYVRDITLDPDITITTDPDQIIVKVSHIKVVEEVVETIEEEAVSVEVEAGISAEVENSAEEELKEIEQE